MLTIRKLIKKLDKIPDNEKDGIIGHIKFEEPTDDLIITMAGSQRSYGFLKENIDND